MKRIFVVDDEPDLREIVKEMLECKGHVVSTADCGQAALYILGAEPQFDVLITDMRMPKGGGDEILRKMENEKKPEMVIVVTGFSDHSAEEITKMGADKVLSKPIKMADLIKALGKS